MNQVRKPVPFDFDALREWSKQELLDWIEDGQYGELIMDPPIQQLDPAGNRKAVKVLPRTREDRARKRANLVPFTEFHASAEIGAAYKRLKDRGHRNPRNKTSILAEMMRHAGSGDWLNIYTKALEKWLPRKRNDQKTRVWTEWSAPAGSQGETDGEHGWLHREGGHEWIISTTEPRPPERVEVPEEEIVWAISKDGSAMSEALGFRTACAWVARQIDEEQAQAK